MEPTKKARPEGYDAVGEVRRIRDAHAETLRGKSAAERIAFYQEKARRVHHDLEREREGAQRDG